MGTTEIMTVLLLAVALLAHSAHIDYQPIKIVVNENYNDLPEKNGQELPTTATGFVHQGANFFFNPEVRLPPGLIPPHIEALLASLHHKDVTIEIEHSPAIVEEEDTTALKPVEPIPEVINTDNLEVLETDKCDEVPEIIEVAPALPIQGTINMPVELPVPDKVGIVEEDIHVPPLPINDEPEPAIQELAPIPDAPVLPPLPVEFMHPVITEEVDIKEPIEGAAVPCAEEVSNTPILIEEPVEALPPMPSVISEPIVQSIVEPDLQDSIVFEDTKPCESAIVTDVKKELIPEIGQNPSILLDNDGSVPTFNIVLRPEFEREEPVYYVSRA